MRCRACGYDLRGLEEYRCPECGRAFHPGRPWTYQGRPLSGRRRLVSSLLGVALIASPLVIAWLHDAGTLAIPLLFWPLLFVGPAMLVTGFAIECEVLRTSAQALTGQLPWIEHERAFAAAFVVSALIVAAAVVAVVVRFAG